MLSRDFKEFAELLNANGVEYLVVGGYALAVHGQPRYTGDLDLWLRVTPGNVERVLRALADFGFGSVGLSAADFMQPEAVIQLGHPPGRIDLLTLVDGVDFDACFAKRTRCRLSAWCFRSSAWKISRATSGRRGVPRISRTSKRCETSPTARDHRTQVLS